MYCMYFIVILISLIINIQNRTTKKKLRFEEVLDTNFWLLVIFHVLFLNLNNIITYYTNFVT